MKNLDLAAGKHSSVGVTVSIKIAESYGGSRRRKRVSCEPCRSQRRSAIDGQRERFWQIGHAHNQIGKRRGASELASRQRRNLSGEVDDLGAGKIAAAIARKHIQSRSATRRENQV